MDKEFPILKSNGDVYAVGHNVYGQVGNGTKTNTSILSKVKEMPSIARLPLIHISLI